MTEYQLSKDLHRIALGDNSAFERFYQATSPRLMSVSYAILRERTLAEEALQDTYLKIWHAASDYRSDAGSVMCWITSMVRYRAIDMLRHARRQPLTSQDIEQLLDQQGGDALPVTAADTDKLEHCMSDLDGTQRQSIHLAFLYGLSHREVSDYLGEALGSIKSWIRRGLESLKRCLQS
ncbi:RNA polymerase sigma-70 factor (ECF subfamily) [Idiomarina fontislapidosi]|uniref:RNA polymerase subunit sigma-70 n=1 Tax=Idiomarina fontislapidosi TaxID=263723 RepID=A0A432YAV6_9GAMM|nr:sigma-70 family RNA polymerase sigma factor [Idiomarina fontislapidosi]PYE35168.1 RNA polymerase sigma-70 factor (ECF subfamily) [Idiomarina fontislapidosi]RUO58063.1 RNA polymerase subunit sigma-70 [Idiomarina fontislapidosi]|tara:strand:+ start:90 stop:626 length:537 start_codon:yes stop_codon:yes gene_type:complete